MSKTKETWIYLKLSFDSDLSDNAGRDVSKTLCAMSVGVSVHSFDLRCVLVLKIQVY